MARGDTNGLGRAKPGKDRVINSGQRQTMAKSLGQKPDAPSATEFRTGMLEPKKGAVPDPLGVMGDSRKKNAGLARNSLGARYTITPSAKIPQPDPGTGRNVRTVPSVMGERPNFWGGGRG